MPFAILHAQLHILKLLALSIWPPKLKDFIYTIQSDLIANVANENQLKPINLSK